MTSWPDFAKTSADVRILERPGSTSWGTSTRVCTAMLGGSFVSAMDLPPWSGPGLCEQRRGT